MKDFFGMFLFCIISLRKCVYMIVTSAQVVMLYFGFRYDLSEVVVFLPVALFLGFLVIVSLLFLFHYKHDGNGMG